MVDKYKTSADATKGLSFLEGGGLALAERAVEVAPVGSARSPLLVRYADANIAALSGVDEQFTEGRHEADVSVWAGRAGAATKLAPQLAKKLDARIKLALA